MIDCRHGAARAAESPSSSGPRGADRQIVVWSSTAIMAIVRRVPDRFNPAILFSSASPAGDSLRIAVPKTRSRHRRCRGLGTMATSSAPAHGRTRPHRESRSTTARPSADPGRTLQAVPSWALIASTRAARRRIALGDLAALRSVRAAKLGELGRQCGEPLAGRLVDMTAHRASPPSTATAACSRRRGQSSSSCSTRACPRAGALLARRGGARFGQRGLRDIRTPRALACSRASVPSDSSSSSCSATVLPWQFPSPPRVPSVRTSSSSADARLARARRSSSSATCAVPRRANGCRG